MSNEMQPKLTSSSKFVDNVESLSLLNLKSLMLRKMVRMRKAKQRPKLREHLKISCAWSKRLWL